MLGNHIIKIVIETLIQLSVSALWSLLNLAFFLPYLKRMVVAVGRTSAFLRKENIDYSILIYFLPRP